LQAGRPTAIITASSERLKRRGTRLLVASKPISFSFAPQDHPQPGAQAFQLDHSLHNLRQVGQVLWSMISAWLALMLAIEIRRQARNFHAP